MWIVIIEVHGEVTGEVGPYEAECLADQFVDEMQAKLGDECLFKVHKLMTPQELREAVQIKY